MKSALLFCGGWDGHQPEIIANLFSTSLKEHGIHAAIEQSLDCLNDGAKLKSYSLIIPCWTMGQLSEVQTANLSAAVKSGVGLAGAHGGMGDAFRGNLEYEWMTGGHFVGHPHVGDYTVRITDASTPITAGVPQSFAYRSEQYYLMVDPGIHILAETDYTHEGRTCTMPVAWTKQWGKGRVFYSSLGHAPEEFEQFREALTLTIQGLVWAAGGNAS